MYIFSLPSFLPYGQKDTSIQSIEVEGSIQTMSVSASF